MNKIYLTNSQCHAAAVRMASMATTSETLRALDKWRVYGVPRGGIPVAYLLASTSSFSKRFVAVTETPEIADLIVDDLVDSGATRDRYLERFPKKPFLPLMDFVECEKTQEDWIVFPWEVGDTGEDTSSDDIFTRLLEFIGEDPSRGGLLETPKRAVKAWQEWTSGYGQDAVQLMKSFEDGAEAYDEMIVIQDIPFYSHCEHHLAPFFGTATIGYIPNSKAAGLSKCSRVLDVFARRLQMQERITTQVAQALMEGLAPKGVGVILQARHMCMESRGICKQGHQTITSSLLGVFRDQAVREEFFSIAHVKNRNS